jgi:hypothetical protein
MRSINSRRLAPVAAAIVFPGCRRVPRVPQIVLVQVSQARCGVCLDPVVAEVRTAKAATLRVDKDKEVLLVPSSDLRLPDLIDSSVPKVGRR